VSAIDVGGYLILASANAVMYLSLAWFLAKSFKFHRFKVTAFLIWIVPFVYSLFYAGSLLNVFWMLIFTPFYGSIVMILVYPVPVTLFYAVSYGSLLTIIFFLRKKSKELAQLKNFYKKI
jgi:hypothetical protein